MYFNINKIIIIIILIKSIRKVLNLEQFNCDTNEKKNQLNQLNTRRFLLIKDKIHIITNDKVYTFGIPYYFKDQDNYYFIKRQPFIEDRNEINDYNQLKGYITIDSLGYTFDLSTVEKFNESLLSFSLIESNLTRTNIENIEEYYYILVKGIVDRYLDKNSQLFTGYLSGITKDNMKYFQVQYIDQTISILISKNLPQILDNKLFDFKRNYDIKFAINYQFDSNYDKDKIKRPYSLIEFDNKYFQIYQFDLDFNYLSPYKLSVDEFFNCNYKIKYNNDIKGILYDKNRFFIFINQFYIQINESKLIDNNFRIHSDLDYQNMNYLKFENQTIQQSILFETNYTKWLKTIENQTYLLTYNRTFNIELNGNELKFNEFFNLPNLKYCPKQTLVINDHIFCFIENQYYYLDALIDAETKYDPDVRESDNQLNNETDNEGDNNLNIEKRKKREAKIPFESYLISSIFKNTEIDYDNTELELIFNYKDNQFIMMTKLNAYIINYNSIKLLTNTKQLTIDKNAKITKIKSYLFQNSTNKSKLLEKFLFALTFFIIILITSIIAHKGSRRFVKEKVNNYLYKVQLSDQETMAKYSFPDIEKQNKLASIKNKSDEDRPITKLLLTSSEDKIPKNAFLKTKSSSDIKSTEDKVSKSVFLKTKSTTSDIISLEDRKPKSVLFKTKSSTSNIKLSKLKSRSPSLKSNLHSNKILTKVSKNVFKLTNKAPSRSSSSSSSEDRSSLMNKNLKSPKSKL